MGLEPTIPFGDVVQQTVGTCIQKTDEVGESESYGALSTELRRDAHANCAGGTRTHDPRVMTHVLQFGSRSYLQGDEVVARGSVRESNPPTTFMVASCTGQPMYSNRQSPVCFQVPNEGLPRVFGLRPSVSASMLPIVDWPLCLRETPAPFTSRSPGIATLGPSCTPNGQSGIGQKTSQRRKGSDVVIVQGCSLNRQLAGQRRRWESNPLESCFAGSRRTVWLQRRKRPRQESNLDLNLRRVACPSSTPRGRKSLSSPPRS